MITDHRYVTIGEGYWKQKQDLNRNVTMKAVYDRFDESGRIDAFRCDWKAGEGRDDKKPHFFWDSDVAKWMEGAAYILERERDPELEAKVESLIDEIEKNQQEDGYFNIWFMVCDPGKRWTDRELHELYCAGHLMEAACAYYNATGRDRFLKCMEKYADHIAKVFVTDRSAEFETPGHPEIEIALYRMYKTTGEIRYLDLMRHFLERRGQPDNSEHRLNGNPNYAQEYAPVRDLHRATGHAVRAVYLYSGMADYAGETEDEVLLQTCRDLFDDITKRKMYVTGGIGSTNSGEAFTIPYDLPNAGAYSETCAAIGMTFFANRMFRADSQRTSRYADIVELELYNGGLSGLSIAGDDFFYENPLEINVEQRHRITATSKDEGWPISQRLKLFWCSCCPPNINRFIPEVGDFFYGYDEKTGEVYVNQFAPGTFAYGGAKVTQTTDYPYDGKVIIDSNVPVLVRIPGWCKSFTADREYTMSNGYARFESGHVSICFEMTPELIQSSPRVTANLGKAVFRYGPFIFCAEGVDNGGEVHSLYYDSRRVSEAVIERSDWHPGLSATVPGFRVRSTADDLYSGYGYGYEFDETDIRLIPYAYFANRGESDMLVYLNVR